jgi:hypothetical protein
MTMNGARAQILRQPGKVIAASADVRLGCGAVTQDGKRYVAFRVIDPEIGDRVYLLTKAEALIQSDALRTLAQQVDH